MTKKTSTHDEIWNYLHARGFSLGQTRIIDADQGLVWMVDARDPLKQTRFVGKGKNLDAVLIDLVQFPCSANTRMHET